MSDKAGPEQMSRQVLLVLLLVCISAIGAVAYLVLRPGERQSESIITLFESKDTDDAGINVLQVVDTIENPEAKAQEGGRFKVLITDETKAGASGIARIGGMVTFVPNTRKGDVVLVEVTRVKATTADAVVLERLESGRSVAPVQPPPRVQREERTRAEPRGPASEMVGKVFTGKVTDVGREGDGVVKVDGKIVFVEDAKLGDYIEFRVTDDAGRFARGEIVAKLDAPPEVAPQRKEKAAPGAQEISVQPVAVGEEHIVTITEADRRNPDLNGVARIDNFVIFVPGAKMGDRVRIRIIEMRPRSAVSEVVERLEAELPAP